jgi:hypothetical protein
MKEETIPLVKDAIEATTAAVAGKASTATYVGAVGSIVDSLRGSLPVRSPESVMEVPA